MLRNHLRSHIIGYVALFVALSGTAMATHPGGANTISSEDIITGEVHTADLADDAVNGGKLHNDSTASRHVIADSLTAADLAPDSVGNSELAIDSVAGAEIIGGAIGTFDIGVNQVLSRNIAIEEVNSGDLADNSVGSRELADGIIDDSDIVADAVGISEIRPDSVGGSELIDGQVGAGELFEIHEVASAFEFVTDGTAHDGNYGKGTATATCPPGEELLDANLEWTDEENHNETAVGEILIERDGDDSATASGIFDGGGGPGQQAAFMVFATCIGG